MKLVKNRVLKAKNQGYPTGQFRKWPVASGVGWPSNNSGYGNYGASRNKIALAEWKAYSGSADQDIIFNLPLLRVRSRDLFMGSTIAAAAILTLRTNTVGNGLICMPQVDGEFLGLTPEDTAIQNQFNSDEFDLFADTVEVDAERRNTFYALQDLVFVSQCISGDVLVLLPMKERAGSVYDTRIKLVEADRVYNPAQPIYDETNEGSPRVFGGVELTRDGEVEAYWVSDTHPGDYGYIAGHLSQFTRVPAFGPETNRPVAMLVGEMERPEQRRAVPLFGKCLTEMKQLQRYIESTTIQNVIKSYFTSFVSSAMPSDQMFDNILDQDIRDDLIRRDKYSVLLGPGMVNWLRPGDTITFPQGAGPEPQFEAYVTAMCKFIGAALGIPFEVLLKVFFSSYSASRASLLQFWSRIKVLRQFIVDQFCQPVYNAWMMEAVAKGIIKAPNFFDDPRVFKAWTRCSWSGSSPGSIDPLKEVMASSSRVALGVSTLERESLEVNGSDWRANTIQQQLEMEFRDEKDLPYVAAAPPPKAAPAAPAKQTEEDIAKEDQQKKAITE